MTIYDIEVRKPDQEVIRLSTYKDKTLLIVNTASYCGFTKQFEALQALYQQYKDQGLVVLGFPCNQFNQQDPDAIEQIVEFCSLNYNVDFPMFDKIEVNGDNEHPLYTYLKSQQSGLFNEDIKWNFTKFLVNKKGEVVDRFAPTTTPKQIEPKIVEIL